MGLLSSLYPASSYAPAVILAAEAARRRAQHLAVAKVMLYCEGREQPFEGELLDVEGNVALLKVGALHQLVNLDRVMSVGIRV